MKDYTLREYLFAIVAAAVVTALLPAIGPGILVLRDAGGSTEPPAERRVPPPAACTCLIERCPHRGPATPTRWLAAEETKP